MGRFQSTLAEQNTVIRNDADAHPFDMREAGDERCPVALLELEKTASVDEACDDFAHVDLPPQIARPNAEKLVGVVSGRLGRLERGRRLGTISEMADNVAQNLESVLVVFRKMIRDPRYLGVDARAAEILGRDVFTRRGFHERRAREKDGASAVDDDRLIAHRGNVGAPGGARAHDSGDLRDARSAQDRLVAKDTAEVIAVGEDFRLERKESPAAIDEIDARKPVLERYLLCAKMLFYGDRVIRAAFHRCVVRHDHALAPAHETYPGDEPSGRNGGVVELVACEGAELQKRCSFVDEERNAVADEDLALVAVPRMGCLAAAFSDRFELSR